MATGSDVLRVKLHALQTAIGRTPPKAKESPVSLTMAKTFNELREAAKGLLPPALAAELPTTIGSGQFKALGFAEASYTDVDAYVEQILGLLDLASD